MVISSTFLFVLKESAPITVKYNSKAAALYRDKILTESKGESWSEETSSGMAKGSVVC